MYKKETIPASLLTEMKNTKGANTLTSHYQDIALQAAKHFDSKPSMNACKEKLLKLDFDYPEQLAK